MTYVAQEGGDHYQAEYQHWDWVADLGVTYLPATATKYLTRWRKKNGVQDLLKSLTYIDKLLARWDTVEDYVVEPLLDIDERNAKFLKSNGISSQSLEARIIFMLSDPSWIKVSNARDLLLQLIEEAQKEATGQGQAPAAPTLAATPGDTSTAPAEGRFGANTRQAIGHRPAVDGMEHPFGYDDWHEGGFHSVNRTKTDEGYNG